MVTVPALHNAREFHVVADALPHAQRVIEMPLDETLAARLALHLPLQPRTAQPAKKVELSALR